MGTVGLSTGITPMMSTAGKMVLSAAMFVGRVGTLTVAFAVGGRTLQSHFKYPDGHTLSGDLSPFPPMGTKITPYVSSDDEAKKNQVERMFDGIAHRYDFLNHFFSLGIDVLWRKTCIRILRKESPAKLLDVATGTADFAIEAVRMGLDVHVSGVDISAGMLDVGRKSGGPGMERPH